MPTTTEYSTDNPWGFALPEEVRREGGTTRYPDEGLSDFTDVGGPSWEWEQVEGAGPRGQIGGARYDKKLDEAEKEARNEALRDWGYEEFFTNYNQDFLSGLGQYLPDYDQLLQRQGTTFQDLMGRGSEQQAQLMQGANQYRDIYNAGGYTPLERGQIQQANYQANRNEQAQRAAMMQQMQMRGMGGSGLEAMGALGAQQGGANQALGASTDIATQAQNRALNALGQGTQFAGQAGQAADAFNKAHLGWQDYQQQLQGQWQQQALANQAELAKMQQEEARYRSSVGQAMATDAEAPDRANTAGNFGQVAGSTAQAAAKAYEED